MRQPRRAERDEVRRDVLPAGVDRARVPELEEHAAARLMHRLDARPPRVRGAGVEPGEHAIRGRARMVDRASLGDHQRRPAEGTAAVVLAQPVAGSSVDAPEPLHPRHDEPVPQPQPPNLQRLQQRRDVRVGHVENLDQLSGGLRKIRPYGAAGRQPALRGSPRTVDA
jgi:hypothetical protein